MEKPIIIVHSGGKYSTTQILYDGKAYGKNITEIVFQHSAGNEAKIELHLDGIDFDAMGENAESLKNAIRSIIDE